MACLGGLNGLHGGNLPRGRETYARGLQWNFGGRTVDLFHFSVVPALKIVSRSAVLLAPKSCGSSRDVFVGLSEVI